MKPLWEGILVFAFFNLLHTTVFYTIGIQTGTPSTFTQFILLGDCGIVSIALALKLA